MKGSTMGMNNAALDISHLTLPENFHNITDFYVLFANLAHFSDFQMWTAPFFPFVI